MSEPTPERPPGALDRAATAVSYADGKLALENYEQEPVRLTTITQEKDKKKKD
jgi:hypothetical protein